MSDIRGTLETLYTSRSAQHLGNDPLSFCHRYTDPADPVKYDFSLAHLGISDGCDGKDPSRCTSCPIVGICAQNLTK
jgi:hypothetical protein